VLSVVWTPDDAQRFIRPAVAAASRIHRERPVDLLYTTAPPFSVHLAGLWAARSLGVPWAAEFRDPWTDVPRDAITRSALSDRVEAMLEGRVLKQAAAIVAVTPTVAGWLQAKRRRLGRHDEVLVAYNGIPEWQPPPRPVPETIEILHAGTLYLKRDPRPFLAAIAEGIRLGSFGDRRVRLTFLGSHGEAYEGVPVTTMAAEVGLDGVVHFEGHLPAEECRRRMAAASALLLLAQDQPAQIPNKLYDYLAARRPIIAVADPDGESAALLRSVGGHSIVHEADSGMTGQIVAAVREAVTSPSERWADNAALRELTAAVQLGRVVDRLEQVAPREPGS